MKLSFLLLNYKTPHHVRLCIAHILKLQLNFEYEIVVVDNGSNDGSIELITELYPTVRIIRNATNLGHPAGNNSGLRTMTAEYVAMVNPDIIFRKAEDIEKIISYMDTQTEVAFLGPRLLNPDGSIQHSCYRRYSKYTPLFRRTILGRLPAAQRDIARHLMLDESHDTTKSVEWLLGACLFIRTRSLQDIGLMNEHLFLYFGDYDWCDRAWLAGWRVVYFHDTNGIIHYHKRESASGRFSIAQLFSYVTRIHIKDWLTYLKASQARRLPPIT